MSRRWTRSELAARIDHTLLDPAAKQYDILMASEIARRNECATVCLNSNWVAVASDVLRGSGVGIAAVVHLEPVRSDIASVIGASAGRPVKVILECARMTRNGLAARWLWRPGRPSSRPRLATSATGRLCMTSP